MGNMYISMRFEKIKNWSDVKGKSSHNNRKKIPNNADPNKKNDNKNICGSDDLFEDLKDRHESCNVKERKNGVLALEYVITASPEYFRPDDPGAYGRYDKQKTKDFVRVTQKWIEKEYGKDNVVNSVLHLDEATPHLHIIVSPLKQNKKGKWTQSANKWIGDKKICKQQQTSIAKAVAHLGLKRGIPKEKTGATHTSIKEFYASMHAAMPNKIPKIDDLPKWYQSKEDWKNIQQQKFVIAMKPQFAMQTQNKILKKKQIRNQKKINNLEKKIEQMKQRTQACRDVPVVQVIKELGYEYDEKKSAYRYPGSLINITGQKWYDHKHEHGSGGGIDLVMYCLDCDFKQATSWIANRFGIDEAAQAVGAYNLKNMQKTAKKEAQEAQKTVEPFIPPQRNDACFKHVKNYLINKRKISPAIVDILHKSGRLYAEHKFGHVNCVFLGNKTAEKRSISPTNKFVGLHDKSKKFEGGFRIGKGTKKIILVESAIDAISYFELHKNEQKNIQVISCAGATKRLKFVAEAIKNDVQVVCAYDDDPEGNNGFKRLQRQHNDMIQREIPTLIKPKHDKESGEKLKTDWNDVLKEFKSLNGGGESKTIFGNIPDIQRKSKEQIEKEKRIRNLEKMADAMDGIGPRF